LTTFLQQRTGRRRFVGRGTGLAPNMEARPVVQTISLTAPSIWPAADMPLTRRIE
jgi:hypothetical protein